MTAKANLFDAMLRESGDLAERMKRHIERAVLEEREACQEAVRLSLDLHLTDMEGPESDAIRDELDKHDPIRRDLLCLAMSKAKKLAELEREACAKVAEDYAMIDCCPVQGGIAAVIRARGEP